MRDTVIYHCKGWRAAGKARESGGTTDVVGPRAWRVTHTQTSSCQDGAVPGTLSSVWGAHRFHTSSFPTYNTISCVRATFYLLRWSTVVIESECDHKTEYSSLHRHIILQLNYSLACMTCFYVCMCDSDVRSNRGYVCDINNIFIIH